MWRAQLAEAAPMGWEVSDETPLAKGAQRLESTPSPTGPFAHSRRRSLARTVRAEVSGGSWPTLHDVGSLLIGVGPGGCATSLRSSVAARRVAAARGEQRGPRRAVR